MAMRTLVIQPASAHRMLGVLCGVLCALAATAQDDDLLGLLGEEEAEPQYTYASFKSTRVINSHSLENVAHGVLDFRIGHRFGFLNTGINELFGLDQATIRLGLDYGVTDRFMVGFGRSSYQKTLDGFMKYKLLKQCDAGCSTPLTLAVVASSSMTTLPTEELPWYDTTRVDYFSHRLAYSFQVILGRKFSEAFTLQLMPGLVHRNLVTTSAEKNDVYNMGVAGRIKLNKRIALNTEYFYVLPDQLAQPTEAELEADPYAGYHNSFSIGFDIETGGHVFQLHFTNSTAMFERGFITETVGAWGDGDIHFGFNISRVFTLHNPKEKPKE